MKKKQAIQGIYLQLNYSPTLNILGFTLNDH